MLQRSSAEVLRYWRQTRRKETVLNSNEKAADLDGAYRFLVGGKITAELEGNMTGEKLKVLSVLSPLQQL